MLRRFDHLGIQPADGSRYPFEQRWPGVLQARLGDKYRSIEEGLSGLAVATDPEIAKLIA